MAPGWLLSEVGYMDVLSYIIGLMKGKEKGKSNVEIEGTGYTYTDSNNDGNIEIKEGE